MRDLALALATLLMTAASLANPGTGMLAWVWFSIESPHQMVYGFTLGRPLNSIIAAATLSSWLLQKGNKRLPGDMMFWLLLAFILWMTFNLLFVPFFSYSFDLWNTFMRAFIEVLLAFFLLNTKLRIQGMVWVLIISLGYYGAKGGVFTIIHGGTARVYGPFGTMINDNNNLALAMVMVLPLVYYAWRTTAAWWLRLILLAAFGLDILMVFGSYSRGGVVALGVMLFLLWLRSDRKIIYGTAAVVLVAGGLSVMPAAFWDRMHTINHAEQDGSFMGRVHAWHVAFDYARDHFPFGAGYAAPQRGEIFNFYLPGVMPHAAHSIYFEVLGEHGFIGLAIYLFILFYALRNTWIVIRQTRGRPELQWARELADMCQVALIAFYIGGAALSLAYYDGYLLLFPILSNLRRLTAPSRVPVEAPESPRPAPAGRRVATAAARGAALEL